MINQNAGRVLGQKKENQANIAIYICTLLACLVPRYISTFKIYVGLNISLFTVAVVISFIFVTKKLLFRFKIEDMIFGLWFIFVIGSVWRAEKIGVWAYYIIWTLSAFLFQQLLLVRKNERIFDVICRALVDALFLHLLMGIYEIMTHTYLFEIGEVSYNRYGRVAIGMFHNMNDYATFVTTIFPFALFLFFRAKNHMQRIYYAGISSVSAFMIINSESRGALLALMSLIFMCIYITLRKPGSRHILLSIGIVIAIIALIMIPVLRNYIIDTISGRAFENTDTSDITRINLIKNGLYFLKETHGFGVGAGNLYLWLEERSIYPVRNMAFMHNWYVELLVTFGVVFFAIYLIWHIKLLICLYRGTKQHKDFWNMNNTIAMSFVCFSFVSISSSSNVYSEWVWMYLAFVSTYCLLHNNQIYLSKSRCV